MLATMAHLEAIGGDVALGGTTEGSPLSFASFFETHYTTLAKALLLITGDSHEAEDLAQEAMARMYERWDRVRRMESPVGYLYRTAMNLQRKRLRRATGAVRRRPAPPTDPDPLSAVEARAEIRTALQALPPAQRSAIVLVEWVGMSGNEAAAVLGINAASVRGRIHRAKVTLRGRMGGDDA